jgi:GTP-binding protein Era
VGKSTLLNALIGEHLAIVSPKAQATRLPVTGLRTEGDTQYIFHDLPGLMDPGYLLQQRMREMALATLSGMDVVLHLHPASEAPAPPFARLAGLSAPLQAPILTVYTKADLVAPVARARLLLPDREFEYDPEDLGTQPVRFFVVEYLREAAFLLLGDELPYAFTAEVEEFREAERPMYIRVTLFVERESQKGMVIGRSGSTIKAIGAHARARLEELTGTPVYLDCWVKVLPNWRKSSAALSRFGFPPAEFLPGRDPSASRSSHDSRP